MRLALIALCLIGCAKAPVAATPALTPANSMWPQQPDPCPNVPYCGTQEADSACCACGPTACQNTNGGTSSGHVVPGAD